MNRIGILGYNDCISDLCKYTGQAEGVAISGCYTGYPLDNEMLKSNGFTLFESLNDLLEASDSVICFNEDINSVNAIEKIIKHRKHLYIHTLHVYEQDYLHHLVKLSQEAGIVSQVNMELLFHSVITKLVSLISNPQMIEMDLSGHLLKDREKLVSETSLINICILMQQLVKERIRRLHVQRITVAENNSEALNIRFEFHNGCVSNIMLDGVEEVNRQELKIYQKQSYITANLMENELVVHTYKDAPRIRVKGDKNQNVSIEKAVIETNLYASLGEFIAAVNRQTSGSAGLEAIYTNQKVAKQIFEKLEMHEILAQ